MATDDLIRSAHTDGALSIQLQRLHGGAPYRC